MIEGARQIIKAWSPRFEIDPNWELVKLGDICELIMGQSPSSQFYNYDGDGLPFHQGKTHFSSIFLEDSGIFASEFKKSAKKDDILMSVRAPVGPVNITLKDIAIGRGLCAIRSAEVTHYKYLFYILKACQHRLSNLSHGITFGNINKDQLKEFQIPLPPLEIQKEIVQKLEKDYRFIESCKEQIEVNEEKIKINFDQFWKVKEKENT